MNASAPFPLRPLSIGEIFDRAITLYVRHFVPFTLMTLSFLLPQAVLQFVLVPDQGGLAKAIEQIQHPAQAQSGHPQVLLGGLGIVVLVAVLAVPFVNNAVAVGVASIYNGGEPVYARSFSTVFKRWLPLLGTSLVSLIAIVAFYFVALLALVLVLAIGITLVRAALPIAVIVFVLAAVSFIAVLLGLLMLITVYSFSTYATTLEDRGVGAAVASGFRRIFNRAEFRKALLLSLAYAALQFGVLIVIAIVTGIIDAFMHSYALQIALSTVASAVLSTFVTILLSVYYYDVRTRAEGLDLEVDLGRLTAAS